ncbi:collagenase-like PrtC family protease [Kineothrix alysoides]|uniref:Collagenase-like PrtC family protease n=1 Tax=Kineothrix alysoides TaxID=1469948 RepID=A0A4R1QX27_9FIRM|nr:hypothetical protein [Kineothrix alysoides]TCL57635.1 collagenase-like PrtC family protease [Kineothrix alysoides]
MKIALPCSWDYKFFDYLPELQKGKNKIYELYGSLKSSYLGAGHSSAAIRGDYLKREDVERYVKKVHENGLEFNYTINASCLGNLEFNPRYKAKMLDELEWICSFSDTVTVAVPYLIELVKEISRNRVRIALSTIVGVDSIGKAKRFEELGVDRIVLNINLNRMPKVVNSIRNHTKIDLEILVNDSCLKDCPYRYYHYNSGSHASVHKKAFYLDYCIYNCLNKRLLHVDEILKSPWLRPEDCSNYEGIIDYMKIGGREKGLDWIIRAAVAYSRGTYNENILDLLTIISPESHELGELMFNNKLKFISDNERIEKFFNRFFKDGYECQDCTKCNYCKNHFREIVYYDDKALVDYRAKFEVLGRMMDIKKNQNVFKFLLMKYAFNQYVKDTKKWKMMKKHLPYFKDKIFRGN